MWAVGLHIQCVWMLLKHLFIILRSHLYIKPSREAISAKLNETWLSCGSCGVCVVITGSTWLLRVHVATFQLPPRLTP